MTIKMFGSDEGQSVCRRMNAAYQETQTSLTVHKVALVCSSFPRPIHFDVQDNSDSADDS